MDSLKGLAQLEITKLVEGVEIASDRAGKENRVLGNDGQTRTEIVYFYTRDVDSVNGDASLAGFEEAEKRKGES